MRYNKKFKWIFAVTWLLIYGLGMATWILREFFSQDRGFGPEPLPQTTTVLHVHAVVGLWFLMLFGYLYHFHVQPSWKGGTYPAKRDSLSSSEKNLIKNSKSFFRFTRLEFTSLRVTSGNLFFWSCLILILTVPGLFYFTEETLRKYTSIVHVYVGIVSILPIVCHWFFKALKPRSLLKQK
ncbi:MAG: hypothetical protein K1X29_04660 [Bdellovibrionales bacterium]|nr:hypothetical protein [Bdellovibrionales bacterium]